MIVKDVTIFPGDTETYQFQLKQNGEVVNITSQTLIFTLTSEDPNFATITKNIKDEGWYDIPQSGIFKIIIDTDAYQMKSGFYEGTVKWIEEDTTIVLMNISVGERYYVENINSVPILKYFETVVKKVYLASPPLKLENEVKGEPWDLKTIIDDIVEIAVRRGLMILFEYRPRIKVFKALADKGVIILDNNFRKTWKIGSIKDIERVIPFRTAGVLAFPVIPQLSPTGRFVYYGLFEYGELARFIAGLKTAFNIYGINPTFSTYFDPEKNEYVIKVFPVTRYSQDCLLFIRLNPEVEFNLETDTIGRLGLTGMELEYLEDFVRGMAEIALGRLRSRFGDMVKLGPQDIKLDGEALLSEGNELKKEFVDKLLAISPPPLPSWG